MRIVCTRDGVRERSHRALVTVAKLVTALAFTWPAIAPAAETVEEIEDGSLAAAIRQHGYACAHIIAKARSTEGAAEGFTVWRVRCNSGQFKVTFKGDTGSVVVRVNQPS